MSGAARLGAAVGVVGGGQLGRMLGLAARPLGHPLHVLAPPSEAGAPARAIAARWIDGAFTDLEAHRALAGDVSVVTFEVEDADPDVLTALAAEGVPVHPSPAALRIVRRRASQRRWLAEQGFPLPRLRVVTSTAELAAAEAELAGPAGPAFVKTDRGGFDGRGQKRGHAAEDPAMRAALEEQPLVVEEAVPFERELSVLVARDAAGNVAVHPVAENVHIQAVLHHALLPARVSPEVAADARALARRLAEAIGLVGILVVELFVTERGLLVNEMALRPHNTFHGADRACAVGQFEQQLRAVAGWPLGDPELQRPTALVNLFGDLWLGPGSGAGDGFALGRALAEPTVQVHLYEKAATRPRRKMGHLTATGATVEEALGRALGAERALRDAAGVGPFGAD
ncbi:MAG: ATP-grasp domain-containing protein [Myxococcota bacterium]